MNSCLSLLPASPPHQKQGCGHCDSFLYAPVLGDQPADPLAQDVLQTDFAVDDLLICGRCQDDEPLIGKPKPLSSPRPPNAAERALHEITQLPYAASCPFSIAGKRPNQPHRRVKVQSDPPMLGAAYAFFGEDTLVTYNVIYIRPIGVYFAAVVDAK